VGLDRGQPRRRRAALLVVLAFTVSIAAAACDNNGTKHPHPPHHSAKPTELTFGTWGARDEVDALQGTVDVFNSLYDDSNVEIRSWPDHDGFVQAIQKGADLPDVFTVSRSDLAWLRADDLNQPVDELLDERGVDFGDGYSRDALEAFAEDNRLQCMPYGISPTVIFYNTDLIDFEQMRQRELAAPSNDEHKGWNFDQFTAAAKFATRQRLHTRGVYIDPTIEGLAPFIYSGGGDPYDDDTTPTSLAFSSDGSRAALERTLELLRNPHLTPTDKQLARHTPLELFEKGRVAMIEGDRTLVPELRQVQGLEFDVMPMPSLGSSATVGDVTGLCISRTAASTAKAADLLAYLTSTDAVTRVVRSGYLAPANLGVAFSDDFLQPGRLPEHSAVFNAAVRSMRAAPLLETWNQLEQAVAHSLQQLVYAPGVLDLDAMTTQIDEESKAVLDPESATESPSGEESESPSG
jgi:multiple sugar transport system substrate-binding protein